MSDDVIVAVYAAAQQAEQFCSVIFVAAVCNANLFDEHVPQVMIWLHVLQPSVTLISTHLGYQVESQCMVGDLVHKEQRYSAFSAK